MDQTFTNTGGTLHLATVKNLKDNTNYKYYIKCKDTSLNSNTTDYTISFSIPETKVTTPLLPPTQTNVTQTSNQIPPLYIPEIRPVETVTNAAKKVTSKVTQLFTGEKEIEQQPEATTSSTGSEQAPQEVEKELSIGLKVDSSINSTIGLFNRIIQIIIDAITNIFNK